MGTLLQRRELGMRMRDLRRAHEADRKDADQRENLQPKGLVFSHSELEKRAHKKGISILFSIEHLQSPTPYEVLFPSTARLMDRKGLN